jgi:predicted fused transcriptional regulator/phosphomethylpyrimidine kinase
MQWGWKGNEDIADKSGVLTFEFSAGKASISLPDFGQARHLAQLILDEIDGEKRKVSMDIVSRYARLGDEIANDA